MQQPLPLRGEKDFNADLPKGLEGEEEVKRLLRAMFDGDSFEVKRDFKAGETGFVFIEVEDRGKKSGLSISKATYWAFVLDGHYYNEFPLVIIVTSARLRMLVQGRPLVAGGDGNLARGYLLPIPWLTKTLPGAPPPPDSDWTDRADIR